MGDIREADLLLADEESLSKLDEHRGWKPRWLVTLISTAAVALFVVVATVRGTTGKGKPEMLCAARNCYSASEGRLAFPQLSESDIPEGSCSRPSTFCSRDDDHIEYHDCDGDEVLDPFCNSAEKLKFGFLSSANGCRNNWPNGLCQNQDEPSYIASLRAVPSPSNEITIIHFNDVYQLAGVFEHGIRKGGMSRAAYVIEQARKRNPERTFVVFAGDLLSPSVLSDLFEGEQMVDILNFLNLTAASLGNHEFDFGVETLRKRIQESRFVWLNTNLLDEAGALFPGTQHHKIIDIPFSPRWSEGGDVKTTRVCLFGVAYDVRETMFKDRHRVNYVDALAAAQKEAKILRDEHQCKVVLALTHQFASEDCKLSKALGKSVDLILGGHDHSTELKTVCGHAPYVKADSDLKTQWKMKLLLTDEGTVDSVEGELITLTDFDPFSVGVHNKVVHWEERGSAELAKKIGCSSAPLDAVTRHVRQRETNAGDFVADAVKNMHRTQVALINGGTIRGDKVFAAGDLSKEIVTELHPFGNGIVKIYATGAEIKNYIDDSLKCYDTFCGNFVNPAGLRYTFDPAAQHGQRVKSLTFDDGRPIPDDASLTVALTDFMLSTSALSSNRFYNMVTVNDAVPLVQALFAAAANVANFSVAVFPEVQHLHGIVHDKWPFRLDIDTEYQDWILVAVCTLVSCIWCLPCICGRLNYRASRSFSSFVYTRLHVYFCVATYLNVFILVFTIGVLPDWTVNQFCVYFVGFVDWVLIHTAKLITSLSILFAFYVVFRFRNKIAIATGLEHITLIRFNWRDLFGLRSRQRPIEVFIWKVEGLQSASSKFTKPNDLFVECHMGYNEPMRTRVHNNAGSEAVIRESFQLNIDENSPDTLMTLLAKDQSLLTNSEIARLTLSTRELCGIEDQTGKRRSTFSYDEDSFLELSLNPSGKIWIAVAPVDEAAEEERSLLLQEDSLLPC
ncbi:yfkN [Symbiodinium necroappetens]|uniref:YfkN protein n=1 Tax=Symbiodinium necroappetens TaxID=1628268 RepID=A0A813CEY8_9DINO|nr:yfkN [Symbiodinium necroappetens]